MVIPPEVLARKFSAQLIEGDELAVIRQACADALRCQQDGEQSSPSIVNVAISKLKAQLPFDRTGATDLKLIRLRNKDPHELGLIRERHWLERDQIIRERLAPVVAKVFTRTAALIQGKADVLEGALKAAMSAFDVPNAESGFLANLRRVQSAYAAQADQAKRGYCEFRDPLLVALLAQGEAPR